MRLRDIVTGFLFLFLELARCQQTAHNESQPETPAPTVPAGNSPDTTTEASETGHPLGRLERSRLARIAFLQQHVLDSLGWESPPDIDSETKDSILRGLSTPVFVSRQKHCYFPACKLNDLPDYMNRTVWFDTSSRNIRYFFSIPTNFDPNYEITSAAVKLHLKSRSDCPCDFDHEIITSRLHIKIYQYRRPIRHQSRLRHSNMRLIDAKMVNWEGSRWVSLSVTDAVKRIVQRGRRNGGFEVQVRDMAEHTMNANWVIDPTVCTFETAFDCTHDEADTEETEEPVEPNYSPVLEIVSTTTTIIEI